MWVLHGFAMVHWLAYETHIFACLHFPLSFLWERYVFRKNPYYSHIWERYMGYGNSLGAPYHSLVDGKAIYFVKIHTLPIYWIGMANRPTSIPYCLILTPWTMENLWNFLYGIVSDTHLSIVIPHLTCSIVWYLLIMILPYSRIIGLNHIFFSSITILTLMQSINLVIVQIKPAQSMLVSKYHCSFWPRSWGHRIFCICGSPYTVRN